MPLSINTSIFALNTLATKQANSANNIASSESKQFKKSMIFLLEGAIGAISTKLQRVNTPGGMINQPDCSLEELSNIDLGKELAGMPPTQRSYETNLKAQLSHGEMEGDLLDLIGCF